MERTEIAYIDPDPQVGLTAEQVRQRREGGWENRTAGSALPSEKSILARHCFTFFNLVFAVLALILAVTGSSVTNFGFLGVVLFNLVIGIVQDIRAKRALEKLTLVARQTLKTVRGGKFAEVPSEELVRDDIVCFAAGAQICADGVVRTGTLLVNEALITGEPEGVEKNEGDEVMAGSFVLAGSGRVQLTRVGDDSYAAKLAREAKRDPKASSSVMMAELEKLVRFLAALLVPLGVLYFITAVTGANATDNKTAAEQTVAALVSLIPQGLYLLTSVALAVSSLKLSRAKVLARDLSCIETLARTDILCVDKTGTITEPGLQVEEVIPLEGSAEYLQHILGALYGAVEPDNETARALAELYPDDSGWTCLRRIPFTSQRKWSGGEFAGQGSFLTGAPEYILGARYHEVAHLVRPWNLRGCRVLLTARYEGALQSALDEDRVSPLALIVLSGRIRENAPDTFRFFARQGVTVKVISGDNPVTVADIARKAGIEHADRYVDCSKLTAEELEAAAQRCTVFGRVDPQQKRQLVQAMQKAGHTVAMTGDGVNDVLAMRQADCAVAVAGGAQAAAQVAQLVLVSGDFAGMPRIVNEGRRVVGNIRRAASLFLVKNIFTLAMVLTAMVTSLVYPFQPVHLTVVMALTVGIPSFFFALEPNRERITGAFLKGALWQALPAGLAGFCAVVIAQLAAQQLQLTDTQLSTVCAAALATVGVLVLLTVCRPMTPLRWGVVVTVTVLLVGAFLLPTKLLALDVYHFGTALLTLGAILCAGALMVLFSWLAKQVKR